MPDADTKVVLQALRRIKGGEKVSLSVAETFAATIRKTLNLKVGQIKLADNKDSREDNINSSTEPT